MFLLQNFQDVTHLRGFRQEPHLHSSARQVSFSAGTFPGVGFVAGFEQFDFDVSRHRF